jgi:predicted nucleic acid-binding Zn ribbon protein
LGDDEALMKSLADMMGAVLKQTGSAAAIAPIWARVVGDVVARHTRPLRWEGKTLVIRCDADAWRAALEPEKISLGKKLAQALGEPHVTLLLEVSQEPQK